MANIWIKEEYVNRTENYRFGDSGKYETFTDDKGELFKNLQQEYGKATKMYMDTEKGKSKQVGWVFSKTMEYEDTHDKYVREVWVTIYNEDGELYDFTKKKEKVLA